MPMRLEPQRTIDLQSDGPDATTDKYLKSDERALLIIAEAMGQQMLGTAA
jgi:hypothetical protein